MKKNRLLNVDQRKDLFCLLQQRFEAHPQRHPQISWAEILSRLSAMPEKLWSLNEMEQSGGEPDVVAIDQSLGVLTFFDCATESPKGRRSLCYDEEALKARKENKPKSSAWSMAQEMGVQLLNEEQYILLQSIGDFDTKTSSWIDTPQSLRKKGGAIFGDKRYGRTFVYHNGAESYYAARGFRACITI